MPDTAAAAPKAEPFRASIMQIESQWIDYNGHLNMAYYNVMFDRAIDEFWLELGIGPVYKKERHGSTFTAECHVRYLREIHLGDPVQILLSRARPTTAETRNSTTATKKMILAISIDAPARPPKPKIPAISAITRNV